MGWDGKGLDIAIKKHQQAFQHASARGIHNRSCPRTGGGRAMAEES